MEQSPFSARQKRDKWPTRFLERIDRTKTIILDVVTQLQKTNSDAILDLGITKFEHLKKFRENAKAHSVKTIVHFLDIPVNVRRERILQRN